MKYNDILRGIKNERIAEAVTAAADLYLSQGISEAKMTDIADQAQIGVASLYRYFGTKQLFTVKVASYIWKLTMKQLAPLYTGAEYESLTGIEQIRSLLNIFHTLMAKYRPFLRFVSEFDAFVVREQLDPEQLMEYETCALNMLPVMVAAMEKGVADGTVRSDVNPTIFYYSVTDSLLSMCQKFVWGNVPTSEDSAINELALSMTIDMFVAYVGA